MSTTVLVVPLFIIVTSSNALNSHGRQKYLAPNIEMIIIESAFLGVILAFTVLVM